MNVLGMVYGEWCMVYGAWRIVHGVWCIVYGVWCMMYSVQCIVAYPHSAVADLPSLNLVYPSATAPPPCAVLTSVMFSYPLPMLAVSGSTNRSPVGTLCV
jgi:hypothetical protein